MATLPASACSPGPAPRAASGMALGAARGLACGPRHGAGASGGLARRFRLVLVCALALALALAPGCVVRSRGQYDVSVGKTSRS